MRQGKETFLCVIPNNSCKCDVWIIVYGSNIYIEARFNLNCYKFCGQSSHFVRYSYHQQETIAEDVDKVTNVHGRMTRRSTTWRLGYNKTCSLRINVTLTRVRVTTFAIGKATRIVHSECACLIVLFMRHAIRMRPITLSSTACLAPYHVLRTLSHKEHDFREGKKVVEHKTCVLLFGTIFVWNIFHSKKNWKRYYHKCI
jgi:hypothetical protein